MNRTIGFKERRYIEELLILTKSTAIDCVIDEKFDRVIYLIKQVDMGLAIGKKGENIKKMQKVLGKKIEMVEFGERIDDFIINIFRPVEISAIKKDETGSSVDVVIKKRSDLGIAIGKKGANVEKARILLKRLYHIDMGDIRWEGAESG